MFVVSPFLASGPEEVLRSLAFCLPGAVVATGCRGYILCIVAGALGEGPLRFKNMSLNPLAYLDAYGSLCCLFYGFGWPVKFAYDRRNFKNPRFDEFILWCSGSLANFLIGVLAVTLIKFLPVYLIEPMMILAMMNFITAVFSLVPLYPLAGYRILDSFLNFRWRIKLQKYYSVMMLICVIWLFVFGQIFMPYVGSIFIERSFQLPSPIGFGMVFLITVSCFLWLRFYSSE